MGSTAPAHDDGHSNGPDPAEARPSLGPAIVSGGCAVAVALITGFFNWINRPSASPPAPTPTLAVDHARREPEPVRTASLEPASPPVSVRPREPQYGLNFQAFQAVMKDMNQSDQVRQQVVDRVVGHVVMWQGYVQDVTRNTQKQNDWEVTVTLVEDPETLGQTVFAHPAFCRFTTDPQNKAARLKRGDRVTISGDCASHNPIGTEVHNSCLSDAFYDAPPRGK